MSRYTFVLFNAHPEGRMRSGLYSRDQIDLVLSQLSLSLLLILSQSVKVYKSTSKS